MQPAKVWNKKNFPIDSGNMVVFDYYFDLYDNYMMNMVELV